jgi:hypothetical protein
MDAAVTLSAGVQLIVDRSFKINEKLHSDSGFSEASGASLATKSGAVATLTMA